MTDLSQYTIEELRQMVVELDTPDFDITALYKKFEYLDEIRSRKEWRTTK
jgi:hypothetical protein